MSQENVEIVRTYLRAVNEGKWKAALPAFIHDDVEIDWSRSPAPYKGVYRGRDEAMRFAEALDVWADARIEPTEFIEAGEDVLAPHVVRLRGRDEIEVAVRATYVFSLREGRCIAWRIYQEHTEALEATGLAEGNVGLVRRGLESFNRGDFDALFPEPDREFEWHDQPELPGASIHYGTEAVSEHLHSTLRDMPGYRVDPQEFLDAGTAVVVCGRVSAHGHGSGVPVDRPFFAVFFVESGRVRCVRILGTRAEAVNAAGLSG